MLTLNLDPLVLDVSLEELIQTKRDRIEMQKLTDQMIKDGKITHYGDSRYVQDRTGCPMVSYYSAATDKVSRKVDTHRIKVCFIFINYYSELYYRPNGWIIFNGLLKSTSLWFLLSWENMTEDTTMSPGTFTM